MVTVKEKTTVTQRIRGNCPTHSRTEISVRDVKAVIDEPKEREGTNMGPTPTETGFLGAVLDASDLGSCFSSCWVARPRQPTLPTIWSVRKSVRGGFRI